MQRAIIIAVGTLCLLAPTLMVRSWVADASERLEIAEADPADQPQAVVASAANEEYCSPGLKKVLRRVLQSCGLLKSGEVRGCQPADAKNVATMSGSDFNALFMPMADRAGIVQFEKDSAELDDADRTLLNSLFSDQRGASYFFVVSRSSPEGSVKHNSELSENRAQAVMDHLRATFDDPDLDKEVGLLWLGEEFAQLDQEFCKWKRSGDDKTCESQDLNRSAFAAWIDCRL